MATSNDTRLPSFAEVSEAIEYNPETGEFRWRVQTRVRRIDRVVGTTNDSGHRVVWLGTARYRLHRLAWLLMTGTWPPEGMDIDHVNMNPGDNRWANLRLATRSQNLMNTTERSDNKSGRKGVSWRADIEKWHARITLDGKIVLLGNFTQLEDAVAAREAAEPKYHAEFARSN